MPKKESKQAKIELAHHVAMYATLRRLLPEFGATYREERKLADAEVEKMDDGEEPEPATKAVIGFLRPGRR